MKRINLKHWPQWLTWDQDLLTDGGDDDDDDDDGEDAMTWFSRMDEELEDLFLESGRVRCTYGVRSIVLCCAVVS
jgi:hypothetical protein